MEDFVTFEIAKKLKEKGFNEQCLGYYTTDDILYFNFTHRPGVTYRDCYLSHNLMPQNSVSGKFFDAPTISQILKWLRNEKGIHITICVCGDGWFYEVIHISSGKSLIEDYEDDVIQSYEDATIAGIEYVINNLI